MFRTQKEVERVKQDYPVGSKIRLLHMEAVPSGTEGVIESIDDQGILHMKWENGISMGLIPGVDRFEAVREPIQILKVEPGKVPQRVTLLAEYEIQRKLFDGRRFKYVSIADNAVVLICDEERKSKGLEPNRRIGDDIIVGTFFIAGDDGSERLVSLTQEQMATYENQFKEIEDITQEEVQRTMGFNIHSF